MVEFRAGRQRIVLPALRLAVVTFASILMAPAAYGQAQQVAEAETVLLEEVIVTARKVQESVQEIPMSVQILSGRYLEEADITHVYELQFNIPSLVVNTLGMYGAGFALRGITSGVATHLDGVYLGLSNLAITRLFDLERVEVLKGPQGTLYGRNATGGSMNFITRPPQDEFSSRVEAAYGSFNTIRGEGFVNIPFKKFAMRLAFIGSEGDGYISNTVDNRKFAESDFWGVRGSWLINPTDRLQIDIMAQYVKDTGASGDLWLPAPAFLPDPDDIWLTTVTLANPYLVSENSNVSINVAYDLGYATLQSVSGYAGSEVNGLDDCAGSPLMRGCVRGTNPLKYHQWSQEIRIVSKSDASFDWIAGLYYFASDRSDRHRLSVPRFGPVPLKNSFNTSEISAYAVFGQASLQMAERWSLTGGLRLSYENIRETEIGTGQEDSKTLAVVEDDWSRPSWLINLEYAANEHMLIYGGVSTGFLSGGVRTVLLPDGEYDTFNPEILTAYETGIKSQWLNQRLTLNGSAFYYDFKDLQVRTLVFTEDGLFDDIDNAAKATIYGLDANGIFLVTNRLTLSGGLVWMPRREFAQFLPDGSVDDLTGNVMIRAPEWSGATAITYEYPWQAYGSLSARLEYDFRSMFFYTKENDPNFAQGYYGQLNLILRFESASGSWYAFASGRNLTNEPYFTQMLIQSNPGYPVNYELGLGLRF